MKNDKKFDLNLNSEVQSNSTEPSEVDRVLSKAYGSLKVESIYKNTEEIKKIPATTKNTRNNIINYPTQTQKNHVNSEFCFESRDDRNFCEDQSIYAKTSKEDSIKSDGRCSICKKNIKTSEMFILDNCFHVFHRECMKRRIESKISSFSFPLACPNSRCKIELSFEEILQIINKEDIKEKLKKRLRLNGIINIFECPTKNCPFICSQKDSFESKKFACPFCKKAYSGNLGRKSVLLIKI